MRAVLVVASLSLGAATACGGSQASGGATIRAGGDWDRFGYDAARHNAGPARTGITADNVGRRRHDVLVVTTSYGKTVAVDAASGDHLWTFTPGGYSSWAGSERITNATPVAAPGRRFVYAAAPDGRIHKLRVATGAEVRTGSWPVAITRLPTREKIGPALNYSRGLVLAATGGDIRGPPPPHGPPG